MRHRLLTGAVLALLAWPATGHAQTGGASAGAPTGGAGYGVTVPRLVASHFALTPTRLKTGDPLGIRYRIDGSRRSVRVRVDVLPAGSRRPAARIRMGWKHPGRTLTRTWSGKLAPGEYVARLHAVDRHGRTLARTASASGRSRLTVVAPPPKPAPVPAAPLAPAVGSGVFPVQGAYTYGDRFGAPRGKVTHRGQDILAAEGTPIVTPRGGVVKWRAYQAKGAGYYLVISAEDGRDLVFMHFLEGSLTVDKGATVRAGQVIGRVGQTGDATAPHLHFEIWPDGWYSSDDSQPIDPLPDLQAWAAS
jgi:murein DD-endopeptidase MepM/ murein hydrolase activator NlpD